MPDSTRGVVDAEALAGQTVELLVDLEESAAVENAGDPRPRDQLPAFVQPVGLPVPGPEVELSVFGRAALRRGGRSGARLARKEEAREKDENRPVHPDA